MVKSVGKYQIPFDGVTGSQMHYAASWDKDVGMRDNFVFEDTITFLDMERGRSAAYFHFKRSSGSKVVVFMKDLCDMMPRVVNGSVTGTFTFVKRGQNYGCAMVEN